MEAQQKIQNAVALAVLMINEAGKEINAETVNAVLKAAGIEAGKWGEVMIKSFNKEKVDKLLDGFSSAAPVAAAPVAAASEEKKEEAKEEKKEEEEEEDFGGFGDLF